ncbi:hypothetical protein BOX15_Mlig011149g3 [Macrostomum lignano]|uniref:Uncharacterized protein n=1 Tax=Macrostomum lignano TaxID=282301 RepID=A0A267GIT4_9PLAT|nr:hypothetical protein BOX15_Mlig011149g3 [Macrostomum lignano]
MEQYEKDLAAYKQTDSYRAFQEKLKAQTAKAAQQQADRPSTSAPTAAKQLKKTANLGAAAAVPSAVVKQPKQEEVLQQQQQPQQLLHQQQPMMIVSQHQQQQQFLQPMQLQQLPAQYQLQQQQPIVLPMMGGAAAPAVSGGPGSLLPCLPPGTIALLAVTPQGAVPISLSSLQELAQQHQQRQLQQQQLPQLQQLQQQQQQQQQARPNLAQSAAELAANVQQVALAMSIETCSPEEAHQQLRDRVQAVQGLYRSQGQAQAFVPELQQQIDRILPAISHVRQEVLGKLQDIIRELIAPF